MAMGKELKRFITLLVCTSLSVTSVWAKQNPLKQKLEQLHKQTGIGAVAYALVENGNIVDTGGIGQYGLDNPRPVTADSLFRVGSITKTFTALAVMRLADQGKLRLEQTVTATVPNIPLNNPWAKTIPVTLAMVLEHTAGLQDLTWEEFDYLKPLSLKKAFSVRPEARRLHWPPGYHYSYSNVGAGYAGRMIETVTGEDYDSWFEREILGTLGMHDSQLRWTKSLEENRVAGYDADLTTQLPYWHTLFRPFGGLNTTAADMAKFLLLFTDASGRQHRTVSAPAINRMETPKTSLAAKSGLKTGYGLGIRNTYFKGHRIYGHAGDADGYLAEFSYSKESHRGYFIVINAFRRDLLDIFVAPLNEWLIESPEKGRVSMAKPPDVLLSKQQKREFSGDYQSVTTRFPFNGKTQPELVHIKTIDNALYRCFPQAGKCTKIFPVTARLFRSEDESGASMAFVKTHAGCLFFQTGFDSYQKTGQRCLH